MEISGELIQHLEFIWKTGYTQLAKFGVNELPEWIDDPIIWVEIIDELSKSFVDGTKITQESIKEKMLPILDRVLEEKKNV